MPSIAYVHRFVSTASFSVLVETTVLLFLMRYVFKDKKPPTWKLALAGIIATYATNPSVMFVSPRPTSWPYNTALMVSETLVFIVEAVFYRFFLKTNWHTALILSLICNFSSWYLTFMVRTQLGVTFVW